MSRVPFLYLPEGRIGDIIPTVVPNRWFGYRVLHASVHPLVALLEVHHFSGSGIYIGNGGPYARLDRPTLESPFPSSDLEQAAQFYQTFLQKFRLAQSLVSAQQPDAQSLLEALSTSIHVELEPMRIIPH